ncbi:NYN domain protein [Lyngbya aestuarii BL J]|uniref:NYN domain protein n=1 Tax=Lyngbya aestuarii BL J TaxID=1348334 RepID=U7QKY3_9CYAN|nr:NYN domain-containing protein [Lyngbya aestuarii]ERT07917.1 NYN domain protein [Lyngbya aestuarii BL J]
MKVKNNESKNSQKSLAIAIFLDFENVSQFYIASDLLKFARQQGKVVTSKAYSCNWNENHKSHLEFKGFECIQVDNPDKIKNAVDFQIAIDCFKPTRTNSYPEVIILVTGDCYSQIIQQNLKSENRKLIVLARRGSDCHSLKKQVDEFYYIDQLPDLVKNLDYETLQTEAYICYEDAVNCLI